MMYTRETDSNYRLALENNQWYYIENHDHLTYLRTLDYLEKYCSSFVISDNRIPEYITSLPEIKNRLAFCLTERRRTDHGERYGNGDETEHILLADDHHYRICQDSVDILRGYQNFISIDISLDIRFFAGDKCVLTTIGHERICFIDPAFFLGLPELRQAEEKIGETVGTDPEQCYHRRLPCLTPIPDRETYLAYLHELLIRSHTISIIAAPLPNPALTELQTTLHPHLISSTTLDHWPGRWHAAATATEYLYPCNEVTIEAFKKYDSFFAFGTDLSFNKDTYSVFYALAHEQQCVIDTAFFREVSSFKPMYHPFRFACRRYRYNYQQCLNDGILYALSNTTHDTWLLYLDKLLTRCDTFHLITPKQNLSEKLAELQKLLEPFQTTVSLPLPYPGTWEYETSRTASYTCCAESIAILKTCGNFFDLGEHTDILFCRKAKGVLYTIADEHLCVIDLWTLGEPQPGIRMADRVRINDSVCSEQTIHLIMAAENCASRADWEQYLSDHNHSWEPVVPAQHRT